MTIILSAVAAIFIVVFVQYKIVTKNAFKGIKYRAYFSQNEVYAGDYIYLYEEISNEGKTPVTLLKADTELPEGLVFTLFNNGEEQKPKIVQSPAKFSVSAAIAGIKLKKEYEGKRKISYAGNIQSLFLVRPGVKVKRRWRVYCRTRGEFELQGVLLTTSDSFGFVKPSKRIEPEHTKRTKLTVLPVPVNLRDNYTSSRYICGDIVSNLCPVTDPLRICGSREYTTNDPMNRVNWKSTAVHAKLMVNVEEKTVRNRFSVLLNMNSKEIEMRPGVPGDALGIEKNITACASILDRMAAEDIPVRLFYNGDSGETEGVRPVAEDENGLKIRTSGPYRGKRDMIFALRTLAKLKMSISIPAEKMFDHIVENPELYSENENLVIVSSYLDQRMLYLREILAKSGVKVSFYITTSRNLVGIIPEDADVYFCNV